MICGPPLMAQRVKNLPAMQETQEIWVQVLGWEGPLEEGKATHSSILSWRIPWTEGPGQAIVHRVAKETDMTEGLNNNMGKVTSFLSAEVSSSVN